MSRCSANNICTVAPTAEPTPTTEFTPTPTLTVQQACLQAGFTWQTFPNSCVDSCVLMGPGPYNCLAVTTDGCYCGANRCWNGSYCALNATGLTPTDIPPTEFPTEIPTDGPVPPACERGEMGNLDCSSDGCIDTADFELFRQAFGNDASVVNVPADQYTPDLVVDDGNFIDTADYEILRSNFGTCL